MKYHFISVGGAVMHNLALALHEQGHEVTGSDDEIFEPSRGRLSGAGILPAEMGWFPKKIHKGLDACILGMHARKDNPELLEALQQGIPVYSYPEFIYRQNQQAKRAVVGGSHGKTTITSMIMFVLQHQHKKFNYLVGSQIEGFKTMVSLDPQAELAVFEGDEYLASPIHLVPKFHLYHPHIAVISGIAWDHINVFPTFENYCEQFITFIHRIEKGGTLIYCEQDEILNELVKNNQRPDLIYIPYSVPAYTIHDGITSIVTEDISYALKVFGEHNLMNMQAALYVCKAFGISTASFYEAIVHFTGAARRLELMAKNEHSIVFKDFAHSPSKLKATIQAVKQQFPQHHLLAMVELHTFSSLNKDFLKEYKDTMQEADEAVVFFSPDTVALKKLDPITSADIREAFGDSRLQVFETREQVENYLSTLSVKNTAWLLMSSGHWGGIDMARWVGEKI